MQKQPSPIWIALALLLALGLMGTLFFKFHQQVQTAVQQEAQRRQQPIPQPQPPIPREIPQPSPRAPQPLPQPEFLTLAMTDGNPLPARLYRGQGQNLPVLVVDIGPPDPRWETPLMALLAQRQVQILWLDDPQKALVNPLVRMQARWQAALEWLDVQHPGVRVTLLGQGLQATAMLAVTHTPRALSLALIAPEPPPPTDPNLQAASLKFTLVALAEDSTPTWLEPFHNLHRLHLTAPDNPQFAAELAGWLFVALGPR